MTGRAESLRRRGTAGLGLRVKTGYATAILVRGTGAVPEFFGRRQVLLAELDVDDSRQPYHAELERGARIGAAVVKRARADSTRRARKALEALLDELQLAGLRLRAAGLVIGSDVDPLTLGNLHIRAHALEGRFYREALERSAAGLGLETFTLLEREAFAVVPERLGKSPAEVRRVLGNLGGAAGRPWGRDEQLAAMAAWVALIS